MLLGLQGKKMSMMRQCNVLQPLWKSGWRIITKDKSNSFHMCKEIESAQMSINLNYCPGLYFFPPFNDWLVFCSCFTKPSIIMLFVNIYYSILTPIINIYLVICVCAPVHYICISHVCRSLWRSEEAADSLELQTTLSHLVGARS